MAVHDLYQLFENESARMREKNATEGTDIHMYYNKKQNMLQYISPSMGTLSFKFHGDDETVTLHKPNERGRGEPIMEISDNGRIGRLIGNKGGYDDRFYSHGEYKTFGDIIRDYSFHRYVLNGKNGGNAIDDEPKVGYDIELF